MGMSTLAPSRPGVESTPAEEELEECLICGARYSYREDGCSHTEDEESDFLMLALMGAVSA